MKSCCKFNQYHTVTILEFLLIEMIEIPAASNAAFVKDQEGSLKKDPG